MIQWVPSALQVEGSNSVGGTRQGSRNSRRGWGALHSAASVWNSEDKKDSMEKSASAAIAWNLLEKRFVC